MWLRSGIHFETPKNLVLKCNWWTLWATHIFHQKCMYISFYQERIHYFKAHKRRTKAVINASRLINKFDHIYIYAMWAVSKSIVKTSKPTANPTQVTSAQFGQTVLQLKLKNSSRRKLVLSVAAFLNHLSGSLVEICTSFVVFDGERQFAQIDPCLPEV